MDFLNAVWNYGIVAAGMCLVIAGAVWCGAKLRYARDKKNGAD